MEDKQLTNQQSLDLIARMISATRRNFNDRGGAMFLIWGYTTIVVTAIITGLYILTGSGSVHWLWWAIPIVCGILTWRHFRNHPKSVATHLDRAVLSVWAVFTVATVCCMTASFVLSPLVGKMYIDILFTISLMMSMATAVTGKLINFRPVTIGGLIGIGLSFVLPALSDSIWQMPMFVVVFLVAQVIPGHLLSAACKREARETAAKNGRGE